MTASEYAGLLMQVEPRPIRSAAEYRRRMGELEALMALPPRAATSSMVELLSMLISAYEARKFPIAEADPALVLDHLIDNADVSPTSIALDLGMAASTLSNYRNGRRKISLERARQFAEYFCVSPAVFFGQR